MDIYMIRCTTHYLELQMMVNLAIWFITGYLQKHICLNPKVHHKQNRTFMIHYAAQDHRKKINQHIITNTRYLHTCMTVKLLS